MKKFVAIYYAPASAMAKMATTSEEDKAKGMEAWMQWNEKCGDHMVDLGAPMMGGQELGASGGWSGNGREVSGYSILQGKSIEEVRALFEGHPHLSWAPGCTIQVNECLPM